MLKDFFADTWPVNEKGKGTNTKVQDSDSRRKSNEPLDGQ